MAVGTPIGHPEGQGEWEREGISIQDTSWVFVMSPRTLVVLLLLLPLCVSYSHSVLIYCTHNYSLVAHSTCPGRDTGGEVSRGAPDEGQSPWEEECVQLELGKFCWWSSLETLATRK